jgi:hypothetical protein
MALALNMRESFTGVVASDELINLSGLFVSINSAVNFVIYCFMGKKFRRTCVQLLSQGYRCGRPNKNTSDLGMSTTTTTISHRT